MVLRHYSVSMVLLGLIASLAIIGCGGDNNNPLSAFQPEVINQPDAFEFQITNADKVSTTVSYSWQNSGTQATIDHSTVTSAGTATMQVFDDQGVSVYSNSLVASANHQTAAGTAGMWTIQLTFVDFSGTANFRAQKL